ncbi:MAG: PqqD family peptide modification chaperone [Candidatus Acidiferrales bacterium]
MGTPLSFNSIVVVSPDQVSCPLGDESAILSLKNSVYYGMNEVGTRVWALLKEPKRIAEVCDAIVHEYEVDSDRCGQDVLDLIEKLRTEGLIEVREAAAR